MHVTFDSFKTFYNILVQKLKNHRGNWNQNDETAVDYVKNRTHWKETKTEIIPETSIEFANVEQPVVNPFILEIQEGSTYEVTWNGNVYQCVAYIAEGPNSPSIGNGTIASVTGGNDEPFFIVVFQGNTLVFAEEAGTHTVSILGKVVTWHTLDKRYLPVNIATTDDVKNNVKQKMDSYNPVGIGSFSMHRKAGTMIGSYSHAEGYNATASGSESHAEGGHTTASGSESHAEGSITTASGDYSHAEGYNTTASGNRSHAEGSITTASGDYSHAEGSITTASGDYSHAEGSSTTASGNYSHAEGYSTTASSQHQHTQGKYNIEDSVSIYAHIVGNGTSNTKRSNAHTLDWNGVGWFQGGLQIGGTAQDGEGVGYVPAVSGPVQPGQLLSVKAVDENGKPTEWETVEIEDGADGVTPHIGDNGNWWIGDTDTGVIAEGKNGKTPVKGTDYWTAADIAEIKSYVGDAILGGAW